jgi:trehalose 6-phosphate synthase
MEGTRGGVPSPTQLTSHASVEVQAPAAGKQGRLVVVSNRVAKLRKATQTGGLAVALADAMTNREALWFGWSGEIAQHSHARRDSEGKLRTVGLSLTQEDYEGYYLGYGNNVLWPLFHFRLDLVKYQVADFAAYKRVNESFARALMAELRPGDRIWVHDYHLIPLAWELRRLGCTARIGFFLHIPFPPGDIFAALPDAAWLTEALLHYDVLGVQTQSHLDNLVDYLRRHGATMTSRDKLSLDGRRVQIGAFPIGIDVTDFEQLARQETEDVARDRVRRAQLGRKQIIGVDRLDYSKGLPNRLRAFGHLLAQHAELHHKVTYLQIAPPTREGLSAYAEIRAEVESLSGGINGRFSDVNWQPVRFIERAVSRRKLAALFRSSEVGFVAPLRDGMNLVAKEYVAAQNPADPGVLVLSRFAGAAEEFEEALLINPLDTEATAAALRQALEMAPEERRSRHRALHARTLRQDCHAWLASFLAVLDGSGAQPVPLKLPQRGTGGRLLPAAETKAAAVAAAAGSGQKASSQDRLRRMAHLIRPTIE